MAQLLRLVREEVVARTARQGRERRVDWVARATVGGGTESQYQRCLVIRGDAPRDRPVDANDATGREGHGVVRLRRLLDGVPIDDGTRERGRRGVGVVR